MNVVIFGASGRTGHHLVNQALQQGHRVTAFVRDSLKLSTHHEKLKVMQGNVSDYLKTEEAVNGQDAVLSALGANHPFKFDQALVNGMGNIIKAMDSTGVKRLIYLSALAAKDSRKDGGFVMKYIAPKILRTELAGHDVREKMIRDSRLNWTIVQAPMLTNGPLKKEYKSGEDLKTNAFIVTMSRADVADFMLNQLTNDRYLRKTARLLPS